ncbi:hypothetical protein [Microtetraspora glauca]|uniref:Peptidoglycan recognition protein family domain-containing protein n=1 Tax=Microtetraspora glauca TaxID=1996 RepID=A0ABV3GK76_MICGL
MHFVTRKEWGARAPRGPHTPLPTARGVKVHYEGSTVPTALLADHAKCITTVRQIQAFHMDTNGWNDIAYNLLVCPHRYVFEGRGAPILSAANGPGLNNVGKVRVEVFGELVGTDEWNGKNPGNRIEIAAADGSWGVAFEGAGLDAWHEATSELEGVGEMREIYDPQMKWKSRWTVGGITFKAGRARRRPPR